MYIIIIIKLLPLIIMQQSCSLQLIHELQEGDFIAEDILKRQYLCIFQKEAQQSYPIIPNLHAIRQIERLIIPIQLNNNKKPKFSFKLANNEIAASDKTLYQVYSLPKNAKPIKEFMKIKSEVYCITITYEFLFNIIDCFLTQLEFAQISDLEKESLENIFLQSFAASNLLVGQFNEIYLVLCPKLITGNKKKFSQSLRIKDILSEAGKLLKQVFQIDDDYPKHSFLPLFLDSLIKREFSLSECAKIMTDLRQRKKFISDKKNLQFSMNSHYWQCQPKFRTKIQSINMNYRNTIEVIQTRKNSSSHYYAEGSSHYKNNRSLKNSKKRIFGMFRQSKLKIKKKKTMSEMSSFSSIDSDTKNKLVSLRNQGNMSMNGNFREKSICNYSHQCDISNDIGQTQQQQTVLTAIKKKISYQFPSEQQKKDKATRKSESLQNQKTGKVLSIAADRQVRDLLLKKFKRNMFKEKTTGAQNFTNELSSAKNRRILKQKQQAYSNEINQLNSEENALLRAQAARNEREKCEKVSLSIKEQIEKCVAEQLLKIRMGVQEITKQSRQISIQTNDIPHHHKIQSTAPVSILPEPRIVDTKQQDSKLKIKKHEKKNRIERILSISLQQSSVRAPQEQKMKESKILTKPLSNDSRKNTQQIEKKKKYSRDSIQVDKIPKQKPKIKEEIEKPEVDHRVQKSKVDISGKVDKKEQKLKEEEKKNEMIKQKQLKKKQTKVQKLKTFQSQDVIDFQQIEQIKLSTKKQGNQKVKQMPKELDLFKKSEKKPDKIKKAPIVQEKSSESLDTKKKKNLKLEQLVQRINEHICMINVMGETAAKSANIAPKLKKIDWFPGVYFLYKRFYHERLKIEKSITLKEPFQVSLEKNEEINEKVWEQWFSSKSCRILKQEIMEENVEVSQSLLKMEKKLIKKYGKDAKVQKYVNPQKLMLEESELVIEYVVGQFDKLQSEEMLKDPQIFQHISEMVQSLSVIAEIDKKMRIIKDDPKQSIKEYLHRNLSIKQLQSITDRVYQLYGG